MAFTNTQKAQWYTTTKVFLGHIPSTEGGLRPGQGCSDHMVTQRPMLLLSYGSATFEGLGVLGQSLKIQQSEEESEGG